MSGRSDRRAARTKERGQRTGRPEQPRDKPSGRYKRGPKPSGPSSDRMDPSDIPDGGMSDDELRSRWPTCDICGGPTRRCPDGSWGCTKHSDWSEYGEPKP